MYKRNKNGKLCSLLAILMLAVLVMSGCGNADESGAVADGQGMAQTETAEAEIQTGAETEENAEETVTETVEKESEEPASEEIESYVEEETEPEVEYYDAYSSLNELALWKGFSMGAPMSANDMNYGAYKDLVSLHFGSITATNEMKAYSMLNQKASKDSANGMPVMNYETADEMVAWAQENGIGVRGHVLVWDAYMCDWFFREGYKSNGAYVDQETMKARLEYYIEEVITHFEEKFPGVVYCWDVVNEAVGDGSSDYMADDTRHVRIARNGGDNQFYKIIGDDYVELSFLYAKNTVEKLQKDNPDVDIKLFYNDYNTFYDAKRDAICELVTSINSYAKDADGNYRKLCDGVGMQSYIGGYGKQDGCMNNGDISRVEKAIQKYADLGLEVHVTEMAVRNYQNDDTTMKKHAEFYGKLFKVYINANKDGKNIVTNVSVWGLRDNPYMAKNDYSYKMNGPFCGLFDEMLCVKDSFREVYELLLTE